MARAFGANRSIVNAAMRAPYLERDEEFDLARRWRDRKEQAALNRLTAAHMRLVIAIAARFRNFGLPFNDLIQEGHIGLLEAAARFEPEREVRFSTYATWWIRASIQDYVLRNWSIVRGGTSSSQKALFFNLRKLRARLARKAGELDRHDIHREIAALMGISTDSVAMMDSRLSGPDLSLNAPLHESDGSTDDRQDFLVDALPLPDETVGDAIDTERRSEWLKSAMSVLSARELRIVRERRLREETATLESLGEILGISKERVRQIEGRALEKLKHELLRIHPDRAAFL
jgi:RNA polymerase sigma-32 factor